jgi:ABC-type glycerol-3-phosphate transport system substrate-binding protein
MKTLAKLITLVVAVAMLVACGTPATPTLAPTAVPPAATAVPPTPIPPTATPAPVTLRYANWNLGTEADNNAERQMIKAYTDAHPWVTIEIVDMSAEGGWDAVLTGYAAKGELPDVFMANNVPLYVQNGWLADVSSLAATPASEGCIHLQRQTPGRARWSVHHGLLGQPGSVCESQPGCAVLWHAGG